MVKRFSKKYGNKGIAFQITAIRKLCQDACQRLTTSLLQEQAAKTNVSMVRIHVFSIMHSLRMVLLKLAYD